MTVLEATQRLWQWFSQNHTFSITKIKDLILIAESSEETEATVRAALLDFEKLGLIVYSPVDSGGKRQEYWILKKPFNMYEQNVTVSAPVAGMISEFLNAFMDENYCNPANITEKDIAQIMSITSEIAHGDECEGQSEQENS